MILNKHILIISTFLLIAVSRLLSQIPVIKTPQPATMSSGIVVGNYNNANNPSLPSIPNFPNLNNIQRQQQEMYERDRLEVQRINMEQMVNNDLSGFTSIQYSLPSFDGEQGTEYYHQTATKLLDMLNGKTPLNLKEAVFSVENAFFEGMLDRTKYEESISRMATIAQLKAKQDGYNWNNPETKNIMLFRVMADTLKVKLPMHEKASTSFPMQYDFDDYRGEKDYSKMFVTKLINSHTGQCHSLPLLYLILCEKVGAEANLAFSPHHTYIKFKDKRNNWYNLELTQGRITTDAFIVGSGFISSTAIKNKVYMEAKTKQQVIAHCLSDLASGYVFKYGYDQFVIQCVDSALSYDSTNNSALAMKANYHGMRLEYVANQIGRPPLEILKTKYPQAYKLLEERNDFYRHIDDIGYVEMPKDVYETWLNSVNQEKERREQNVRYKNALRLIE